MASLATYLAPAPTGVHATVTPLTKAELGGKATTDPFMTGADLTGSPPTRSPGRPPRHPS